jgi:hypothetical protein
MQTGLVIEGLLCSLVDKLDQTKQEGGNSFKSLFDYRIL